MAQHTQEPWSYEVHELSEGYSAIVYDERGHAIADHLAEDRARLIAAAPELLTALKDIRAELSSNPAKEPTLRMDIAYRIADAALSKATAGGAV